MNGELWIMDDIVALFQEGSTLTDSLLGKTVEMESRER